MWFRRSAVWGILGLLIMCSAAPGQVPTFNDVAFATVPRDDGGTVTVMMDIYLPSGGGPRPLLIWIHGGGWQSGSHNGVPGSALQLVNSGVAVASIGYRLSGEAIFPAQIHDVKGAVRFLRSNASTYNLDANRFISWGSSAGGHLSALLATSGDVAALEGNSGGNLSFSSRVMAGLDYFGPIDLFTMEPDETTPPGGPINHDDPNSPESHLVGWDQPGQGIGDIRANINNPNPPYPALVSLCNQVNPMTWLSVDDPPMFIAHGTNDTSVPIRQSQRLADGMLGVARFHDYRIVPSAGHGNLGAATEASARNFILSQFFSSPLAGDSNCDGAASLADLAAFAQRMADPTGYEAMHPGCPAVNSDFNGDGRLDAKDVGAFVGQMLP